MGLINANIERLDFFEFFIVQDKLNDEVYQITYFYKLLNLISLQLNNYNKCSLILNVFRDDICIAIYDILTDEENNIIFKEL